MDEEELQGRKIVGLIKCTGKGQGIVCFFVFHVACFLCAHLFIVRYGSSHNGEEERLQPVYFSGSIECNYTEQWRQHGAS